MQAVFTEIVAHDEEKVLARIESDPTAVSAIARGKPRKYAGQSTLQVAIRAEAFGIAEILLARGADPNFVDEGSATGWHAPILHDAIAVAVKRSRWLRPEAPGSATTGWRLANSAEMSDAAFAVLSTVLDAGARVDALDSYRCSALGRAARAAREILPAHWYNDPDRVDVKPLNPELVDDLARVFRVLYAHGADPSAVNPQLGHALDTFYAAEPVGAFLAHRELDTDADDDGSRDA